MSVRSVKLNQKTPRVQERPFSEIYKCPKATDHSYKIRHGTVSRQKKGDYISLLTIQNKSSDLIKFFENKRPQTPSSAQYSHVNNWSKTAKGLPLNKEKKVTYIDAIFEREKRLKSPGPSTYRPIIKDLKSRAWKIGKDPQLLMFNDILLRSKGMPSCQTYKINMNSIEPKSKGVIFCGKKKEDFKKVTKKRINTGPGAGHYKEADRRFVQASDPQTPKYSFFKEKRVTCVALEVNRRKSIPAVGKYEAAEQYGNTVRAASLCRLRFG